MNPLLASANCAHDASQAGELSPTSRKTIPLFKVFMPESVMEPLRATLMSGFLGQGPRVEEFEKALSERLHAPRTLRVN